MSIHATGYFPSQHWFTASLPLSNSQRLVAIAGDFPDEIADRIFIRTRKVMSTYFKFNF